MNQTRDILRFVLSFLSPIKIEERKGDVTPRLEVYLSRGRYVLHTADANYSFGGLHTVFRRAFSRFDIRNREVGNALILGFGAGSVASILCDEYKKSLLLTGVEKDPVVIDLARKYFHLDRYKNLSLHVEDAGKFVERCDQKFDLVAVDVFVGVDVPDEFKEEKFLAGLGRLLSPQAICFFNVAIHDEKVRSSCASLFEKMDALIGKTELCPVFLRGATNWVFVCDKGRN
jgi:spermidine synthase